MAEAHKVSLNNSGVPLTKIFFVRFAGTLSVLYSPFANAFFSVCLCVQPITIAAST